MQHRFPVTLSTDPDMRSPRGGYAHINGMHVVDGVLVASMRGCSKVLGIDVKPGVTRGDVLWRMGRTNLSDSEWAARDIGPRPLDFINDPEGEFCGQHTARFLPNGNIFLFDNGVVCAIDPWTFEELGREGYDFSRAVEYALDLENHEAVFVRDHSLRGERSHLGYATGNVDALDNGDWLVSWGRVLGEDDRFPDNEMATLVDPATGQDKLAIRFRELPSDARARRINATVAPAEALAPQPVPLTAEFPASDHTSLVHTGSGDAPHVIVAFNQPVADFSASSPSISVQGGAVESVGPHLVAGEPANAYVVVLTPDGDGPVTLSLVSGQSCASSGVCTAGGTVLSEVPAPHVIALPLPVPVTARFTSDAAHPTKDPFTVTIVFSEAVTGLAIGEITVTNGAASSLTGSGATYEVEIEPAAGIEADVTVTVAAGAVMDALNNANVLASAAFAADTKAPVLAVGGAAANGASLVLAWSEALDQTSTPGASAFAVTVDGAARTVSGVSLSGSTATLTLDPAVVRGNRDISVSYSPPSGNPLRDVRGNAAAALSGQAVMNDTPNAPPQITTAGPFSANEGTTSVAILAASDDATAQADLIWSIPAGAGGGADASSFTLSQAGALAFAAAKDYETPDDDNADRTYEVTVQVSDGTDSDMAELLVTLLNVPELTAITGPASVEFPENSWSRVATFTASSEEDRAGIDWVLAGTDSDHFSIDSPPGALRFALDAVAPRIFPEPPDFEAPVDGDAANTYELTLLARAGSSVTDTHTFTVTVTDVDEEGALSLSSTRPALGAELTAVPTDPDGVAAGTALWQWERSTGRNSWAVIDGAAAASYTPVAADTNTFLRVTATYADEHGTGKTVSEVAPNVVTGPLLTGLTAETDDSQADTARGLYPAFDPLTLHYGIGCNSTDTLVLTVSAPANARVAVAGVQAASAAMAVDVSEDSDVAIRVTDASGAGTTYVVHCLPESVLRDRDGHLSRTPTRIRGSDPAQSRGSLHADGSQRRAETAPRLLGFGRVRHQVPPDRRRRCVPLRVLGQNSSFTVLDEDFEVVEDNVKTVGSSLRPINPHDFQILENGNYLLTANPAVMGDFRDFDLPSPADGGVDLSSVAVWDQTLQIVTPEPAPQAVFTWGSWGNIAAEDCVQHRFPVRLSTDPQARPANTDIAHINGAHMVDGVLAASLRGCSKVLGIDVATGDVVWRMGRTNLSDAEWAARDIGPRPLDFINDPEGEFCGQHSARILPKGNVFLFDNGSVCVIDPWTFEELGREGSDFSRAVEYALDLDNHEAVFVRDHSLRGDAGPPWLRQRYGVRARQRRLAGELGPASRCKRHDPGQRDGYSG